MIPRGKLTVEKLFLFPVVGLPRWLVFLRPLSCSCGTLYSCDLLRYSCRPRPTIPVACRCVRASPLAQHSTRRQPALFAALPSPSIQTLHLHCHSGSIENARLEGLFGRNEVSNRAAAQPASQSGASSSPQIPTPSERPGRAIPVSSTISTDTAPEFHSSSDSQPPESFSSGADKTRQPDPLYSTLNADYAALPRIPHCIICHQPFDGLPLHHCVARLRPLRRPFRQRPAIHSTHPTNTVVRHFFAKLFYLPLFHRGLETFNPAHRHALLAVLAVFVDISSRGAVDVPAVHIYDDFLMPGVATSSNILVLTSHTPTLFSLRDGNPMTLHSHYSNLF